MEKQKTGGKLKGIGLLLAIAGVIAWVGVGPGHGWPMALLIVGFGVFIAGRLKD